MKVGLIGFAGSGKTTVFRAVTGLDVAAGAGGGKVKPNLGTTKVYDPRVERLSAMYNPRRTVNAEIVFVDLPGGSPERGSGGLQPSMVQHIGDMNALTIVVRAFDDPALGLTGADPVKELSSMYEELILNDLVVVDRRVERLRKEHRHSGGDKHLDTMERIKGHLEGGSPLTCMDLSEDEVRDVSGYRLLSVKPLIVIVNVAEDSDDSAPVTAAALGEAQRLGLPCFTMCASIEAEIAMLEGEEQQEFLREMGMEKSARDRFISKAYETLNLISFLTVGPDEVRAWTIRRETPAVRAARAIHSDIERGFIRAEVVRYEDLVDLGSEAKCRAAGKLRSEGKGYLVQDGDVIHFLFNV